MSGFRMRLVAIVVLLARVAYALDPGVRISQYVHTNWNSSHGLVSTSVTSIQERGIVTESRSPFGNFPFMISLVAGAGDGT